MSPEQLSQEDQEKLKAEGETSGKSDVDALNERIEKLEAENKKIREETIEKKTSPAYFESMREQKRREREARILNTKLPPDLQVNEAQLADMSAKDLAAFITENNRKVVEHITRDKIVPMKEQEREDSAEVSLKDLSSIDPEWQMYLKDMVTMSRIDPGIQANDCYMAVLAKNKDWKRLEKFRAKLEKRPEQKQSEPEAKMAEEKEKTKAVEPKPKDYGQRPAASIAAVKRPTKGMTLNEAATKAYEEVFEQGKGG